MSLLRNSIRSNSTLKAVPLCFRQSPKHFSTEPPPQDSSEHLFLQNTGAVYAKLSGITKHTLKTDIINLLDGSNLTPDNIKVSYSRDFMPVGMMVQFPSRAAFDIAFKTIGKRGRLYKLERADQSQWDILMPYDGKTLLLLGLPQNAVPEDVARFLSGCEYDSSSMQLFLRQGVPTKSALVRFHTRTEAMNSLITKNRGFCLNSQISVRVLQ